MATSWFLENHPEWFSANSPVLVAQGDQLPPQTAVAGPIPAEARSGEGYTPASNDWFQHNAPERFARSFNSAVGIPESVQDKPSEALEGLKLAVTHPSLLASSLGEMGKGIWQGMSDTGQKAIDSWKAGHPIDAAGYAIESGIPIMGPMLAHSGEQVASGDVAGGLGTMAGIVGPMLVGNPQVRANVAEAAKAGTTAIAREAVKNPMVREVINTTSPGIIEGMGDTLRDASEKGAGDKSTQPKQTPAGATPTFIPSSVEMPKFSKIVRDGRTVTVGKQETEWRSQRARQVAEEKARWYESLAPEQRRLVDGANEAKRAELNEGERQAEAEADRLNTEEQERFAEEERERQKSNEAHDADYDRRVAFMDGHQQTLEAELSKAGLEFQSHGRNNNSRYLTIQRPGDYEEPVTVRISDHGQPKVYSRDGERVTGVTGGYDEGLGYRHDAADISIDPESGKSVADVLALIKQKSSDSLPLPAKGRNWFEENKPK